MGLDSWTPTTTTTPPPLHPPTPTAQLNRRRLGLISVFVVDNITSTIKWNGSFLHRDTINGG